MNFLSQNDFSDLVFKFYQYNDFSFGKIIDSSIITVINQLNDPITRNEAIKLITYIKERLVTNINIKYQCDSLCEELCSEFSFTRNFSLVYCFSLS